MQITIDLPEALQQTLLSQTAQAQTTPEQLISQRVTQNLIPSTFRSDLNVSTQLIATLDKLPLTRNHDRFGP